MKTAQSEIKADDYLKTVVNPRLRRVFKMTRDSRITPHSEKSDADRRVVARVDAIMNSLGDTFDNILNS